mgnify:CR=1 FL=1
MWVSLIIYGIWHAAPFAFVIFYAGLQTLPQDQIEAAKIDGAGPVTTALRIKIPILWPTITLSIFLSTLGSLQLFDLIMPLTGGGPSNQTHSTVSYTHLTLPTSDLV